jgi:hypothetical protein
MGSAAIAPFSFLTLPNPNLHDQLERSGPSNYGTPGFRAPAAQRYAGDRRYVGEPMFIPRPGSAEEGDGWLLVAVHDAATQKGEMVILDAKVGNLTDSVTDIQGGGRG